ncbi:MAG: ABC transporter ATP-binding protein [Clostridiales bacterium]|nr:ABC transporter ATP-binding protein [Clostridiales bacterium]
MKTLYIYIKPHLRVMLLQFVVKFGGTIIELLLPWMLSTILDDIVPSGNMKKVYLWGGLMVLCSIFALLGNVIANRMSTKTSKKIIGKLRHDLFKKVSALSCRQTDTFTLPSLISRMTSDTYNAHQLVDRMQRLGVRAPILLLGGIIVTMLIEPVLTLVLIGTLPLLGLVIWYVSRKGIPMYTEAQSSLDKLVNKVQENMTGVRVIKALSKSEYEKGKFDEVNLELAKKEQRAGMLMALTNPAMNLLLNIGLTLVIVVGAFRVHGGFALPGKIIAFLSYFTIILNALMMVSRLFLIYTKGAASAKRIAEVLEAPEDIMTGDRDHKPGDYHIEFRDVCFSYNKIRSNILNLSFCIKRGETLGIIGPTGSGKSTIIQLLLRFYDPDAGEIRISGDKLSGIPPEELHGKFGVVFQNDFLYEDTIYENIDFGRMLSEKQIKKAAVTAQAAEFIAERQNGFQDILAVKGANLSGGQKQRILIARALAGNPEILILDDSSSALDYKTDAELRKMLKRDFSDTTTVIVAQRVSSIMYADKILVLDDAQVIGYGTHKELLFSCESYKEIYRVQMGVVG